MSVELSIAEACALIAAGAAAGSVNAVAGGGSMISFPALIAVGYPALDANVTNAVAVLPGYVGGSLAYRQELEGQSARIRRLGVVAALGAIAGTALLLTTSERLFEQLAPPLVLLAALLLAVQPWLATRIGHAHGEKPKLLLGSTFLAAVYGGYFGAGLGVMLLAILGLLIADDLQRLNALKGSLSLIIGAVTAVSLAIFGPVAWTVAAIMAGASFAGGHVGVGFARQIPERALRIGIVTLGVGVAIALWAT